MLAMKPLITFLLLSFGGKAGALTLTANASSGVSEHFSNSNFSNASSSLAGMLNPDHHENLNLLRVHRKDTFDPLDLAVNHFHILYNIWQLEGFEVLTRPLTFKSLRSPLISMTFSSIPGASILPRTDQVMWTMWAIITRTFMLEPVDREMGSVYDWQVAKDPLPTFMKIDTESVTADKLSPDIVATMNSTKTAAGLQSDPMTYRVSLTYSDVPLSARNLLLIVLRLIYKLVQREPTDFMGPALRVQRAEFMSEGRESYEVELITSIPDPETAQPGEHMVHFEDLVGGLLMMMRRVANDKQESCFKADIEGFTGMAMVPFTTFEVREFVHGSLTKPNTTVVEMS